MLNIKKVIYESLTFQIIYDILNSQTKDVKKVIIFEKPEDIIEYWGRIIRS